VKKYYRKATMLCHPDKVGSSSETDPDKVYIANRCFAAITEAYNQFKVISLLFMSLFRKKKASNDDLFDINTMTLYSLLI
jgi:hypothetical protein